MHQMPKIKLLGLTHAFSTRKEGNMSFKYADGDEVKVISNREDFLKKIGLSLDDCIGMGVKDDNKITEVGEELKGRGMRRREDAIITDCFLTHERGIFLWLLTADCLPIIFFCENPFVLALAHLGWKSTDLELSQKVISRLESQGASPKNIIVGIGPGIYKESYLLQNPKQKDDPKWRDFIKKTVNGLFSIDIIGYNVKRLLEAGIPKENILMSGIDTASSQEYFSHRRSDEEKQKKEARFATVVGVK